MKLDRHGRFIGRRLRNDRFFWFILAALAISLAWWFLDSNNSGSWRGAGHKTGHVGPEDLTEISGIVLSRRNPGIIWTHNDSGGGPRIFALQTDGSPAGVFSLDNAVAIDWEDIAIGPGPSDQTDYLYLADSGNNNLSRNTITIYRVPEPLLENRNPSSGRTLTTVEALTFRFPEAPQECETLLVDPLTSDIYLVSRNRRSIGQETALVFRAAGPHQSGVTRTLELVASFSTPASIKGGDISRDGSLVLLRAHSPQRPGSALLWRRGTDKAPLHNVFREAPRDFPVRGEPQGEAIAFSPDSNFCFTIGEGLNAPIYRYKVPPTDTNR